MASFPGSVKTYTNKNPGDVIADTHIDDLQDEVTAIEDGFLNGTARLNSSNSTVATLSVTSGSTFAVRPVTPPPHMALVYVDSTVTLGGGTQWSSASSTLAFLSQSILTNSSMHSTAVNPQRLTPQSTGIYQFSAQATYSTPSTIINGQLAFLDETGTLFALAQRDFSTISAGFAQVLNLTAFRQFTALGGYTTVRFANSGPGASTLSITAGVAFSWFSMTKL